MNHANQNPLIQVIIWDQTQSKVGIVLMDNLMDSFRDQVFRARNQYKRIMYKPLGLREVNFVWRSPRRPGVTRLFVVVRDGPQFDIGSIESSIQGTFQYNVKDFI